MVMATGIVNDRGVGAAYFRWHDGTLSPIDFERFGTDGFGYGADDGERLR
jgi:hypothetical protein